MLHFSLVVRHYETCGSTFQWLACLVSSRIGHMGEYSQMLPCLIETTLDPCCWLEVSCVLSSDTVDNLNIVAVSFLCVNEILYMPFGAAHLGKMAVFSTVPASLSVCWAFWLVSGVLPPVVSTIAHVMWQNVNLLRGMLATGQHVPRRGLLGVTLLA